MLSRIPIISDANNKKKRKLRPPSVLRDTKEIHIDEGWLLKLNRGSMDGELPLPMGLKPKYGLQDNYFDINMERAVILL